MIKPINTIANTKFQPTKAKGMQKTTSSASITAKSRINSNYAGLAGQTQALQSAINTSQAIDNIAQTPVERYTQKLLAAMRAHNGNGKPNITGSSAQTLNALTFNASMAFGELAQLPGTNQTALRQAFEGLVMSFFEQSAEIDRSKENATVQNRQEQISLGQQFLNIFFSRMQFITGQGLIDTGMTRAELAFHEAWNLAHFGGYEETEDPRVTRARERAEEIQFQRQQKAFLMQIMREDAQKAREVAEMKAEEARRMLKVMKIAARIAAGHNVPIQDREFLMNESPGMYMLANSARTPQENPRDYETLLDNENESAINTENATITSGSTSTAPVSSGGSEE